MPLTSELGHSAAFVVAGDSPARRSVDPAPPLLLEVGTTDIANLVLNAEPEDPRDVKGSVQFDDPNHPSPASFSLFYIDAGGLPHNMQAITSRLDGSFVLPALPRGGYRVQRTSPASSFDAIVRLGDTELPNGEFTLTGTASPPLTIRMLARTATVNANVTDSAGVVWGAVIHVEPVNPAVLLKAGGTTDQDGNYQESLPPGQYRIWATPDQSTPAAANAVQTVTLAAGSNPTLHLQ